MWAAYRYQDIQSILGDYKRFSSAPSPTLQEKQRSIGTRPSLARSDPPYHRMLRAIVSSAFSPIMISKLEPRIAVIAELLGLPLVDRDIFCVWADKID